MQKGIDYGLDQRIRFFGLAINDEFQPFFELQTFCDGLGVYVPIVPVIALVTTPMKALENALAYDTRFVTRLGPEKDDNICEGVVIQPFNTRFVDRKGRTFMLKKKNAEFMEKKVEKKAPAPEDTEITRLNAEFMRYINDNRLQSVFSKYGPIQEPAQISDFIRWIIADAREDFLKDFGEEVAALEGKQLRKVYNVGRTVAEMLKGAL